MTKKKERKMGQDKGVLVVPEGGAILCRVVRIGLMRIYLCACVCLNYLILLSGFVAFYVVYGGPPLSMEDTFQQPQWMSETMDCTKPCMYCAFFPIHTYL